MPVADVLYHAGGADQTVILTGGVRTPSDALVGPFAVAALRTVNVDLVFMGVHGMDPRPGFTTPNLLEAETDRALVEAGAPARRASRTTRSGASIGISSIARLAQADVLDHGPGLDAEAHALAEQSASCVRGRRGRRAMRRAVGGRPIAPAAAAAGRAH